MLNDITDAYLFKCTVGIYAVKKHREKIHKLIKESGFPYSMIRQTMHYLFFKDNVLHVHSRMLKSGIVFFRFYQVLVTVPIPLLMLSIFYFSIFHSKSNGFYLFESFFFLTSFIVLISFFESKVKSRKAALKIESHLNQNGEEKGETKDVI
jgi:hypothetical protein